MGRLRRGALAGLLAAALAVPGAGEAAAFDGFGDSRADASYGRGIEFTIDLSGGAPHRLELLLQTPGDTGWFVVPIEPSGTRARHLWDTSLGHLTPNTPVTYRWRATDEDGTTTLSSEGTIRYEDDRPELDWQRRQLGEATVHWYGDAEAQAIRFGELTAQGVARSEELLGTRLAGPVDVFVYDSREDFFGALGPGAREWTGAAAFSELRTIFMWLGGGTAAYLERAMVHEVAHIVFHDATDNPYHEPARWVNEGIATWSETSGADGERAIVELEARGGGLFAFDAITEQFPIGERGGRLSYAQGTTMIDLIVRDHGEAALARLAAAYREGASDDEALEAATGRTAGELEAAFFAEFDVEPPRPIEPDPILPSNVDRPAAGEVDRGGVDPDAGPGPAGPDVDPSPTEEPAGGDTAAVLVALVAAAVIGIGLAFGVSRRAARRSGP
ncbi:MAG TPA: peptidase MA family metallohydrolase [Candidatus Angelobacter sp.]|nr:peptidase MA family metallohydrolase [Candidatus Angelobacter sp.]